jgi:hypothetical protein
MKDRHLLPFGVALSLIVAIVPAVNAQCVTGTVTAELQTGGPYAGLFKYTAVLSWDTDKGLSNITIDCGFGQCPEAVCAETFLFDSPSGQSAGEGGCNVHYYGEFNCQGNPSIDTMDPAIKWDAVGDCQPDNTGTATIWFYSSLGPQPGTAAPVFLIKNGQNVCEGVLSGDCPAAPCLVPAEDASWGQIKAKYR